MALGEEHLQVATALNNLALICHAQGRPERAQPLHRRALSIHLSRFRQGLPAEPRSGMTKARSHTLAYLQLLARLEHPDAQAQADMLVAVQLARGSASDDKLRALAARLADLHQQALSVVSRAGQDAPSQSEAWDEAAFNGVSRQVVDVDVDVEALRAALTPGEANIRNMSETTIKANS